jgi:hypothetical protein
VSSKDDVNFLIDARESLATTTTSLLLRLTWFGGLSTWRGRWQRLKRSAMPDRVLEIPAIPQGVSHILVVWALKVKDLIQCPYPTMGHAAGSSGWRANGVHFLPGPLVPALVRLLVHVLSRCRECGLRTSD